MNDYDISWQQAGFEIFPELSSYEVEEKYVGTFDSHAEFAENYVDGLGDLQYVPDYMKFCIDWNAVWETALRFDFVEQDGHYFINY